MATKTEENGIDAGDMRGALDGVREGIDPILDLLEELVGDVAGPAEITDVYGRKHKVPSSLPMYHEVRGVGALRRLWQGEALPKAVKAGAEAAHKQGGVFALITFLLEQSVMDEGVASLVQDVFEGFHGDTPGGGGSVRKGLLSRLHDSARADYESTDENPDDAPTQVTMLLRTGQIVAALIPFSRSILKDARDLSTSLGRPPVVAEA